MSMTYEEVVARLAAAARFGMDFGLARVESALARLGHPERRLGRVIHVGGTNGKGSTSAMAAAILGEAGFRVGLFTSPHLARVTERVRIAGAEIDRAAFADAYERAVTPGLTFFEQLTMTALLAFAEARVDATVLEVGLGGRLDATNVVDADVAVVTGVGLDHEEVLGPDVASIAREKAGIFKAGRVAVVGAGGEPEAIPILVAAAEKVGARVVRAGADVPWPVALAGAHQRANAACAVAATRCLGIPESAQRAGLAAVSWPGRLEEVGGVLLDAAHNPQGAQALAAALAGVTRPLAVVVAVSADKDLDAVVAPVARRAELVVATEAPSSRARPAADVGAAAARSGGGRVVVEPSWREAVARARAHGGRVVVYGSLFLVGAVRAALLGEPVDPVPLADPAKVAPST
jgi:dihydrofolate synthase / folylpolyglutamate synthase